MEHGKRTEFREWLESEEAALVPSNEQVLFILNRFSGLAPYTHEFVPVQSDSQILSGFVSALGSFMGEMTGKRAGQWRTVYGEETTMIVENGEWASGVLAVRRDTTEARSKLRAVVEEFEVTFETLRDSDDIQGSLFYDFDGFVKRIFTSDKISARTLIAGIDRSRPLSEQLTPSMRFKVTSFLEQVTEWQSVSEAAANQGIPVDEAIDIVAAAYWDRLVTILEVPSDEDILAPSQDSRSIVFAAGNPFALSPDTLRFIGALDGRHTVRQMFQSLQVESEEAVLLELGYLLNHGILQRISVEGKLSLVIECMANRAMRVIVERTGFEDAKKILDEIVRENVGRIPWISYVRISEEEGIFYPRESSLDPRDIDQIADALECVAAGIIPVAAAVLHENDEQTLRSKMQSECEKRLQGILSNIVM